jgi:hypothetical protein
LDTKKVATSELATDNIGKEAEPTTVNNVELKEVVVAKKPKVKDDSSDDQIEEAKVAPSIKIDEEKEEISLVQDTNVD